MKKQTIFCVTVLLVVLAIVIFDPFTRLGLRAMVTEYKKNGPGPHGPIMAIAKHHGWQPLYLNASDPTSSIDKCMDFVHFYGGGLCVVRPHSLGTGQPHTLTRRYNDVLIAVYGKS